MSTNGSVGGGLENRPRQAPQLTLDSPNEVDVKMNVSHIVNEPRPPTDITASPITSFYTTTTATLDPVVVPVASGSRGKLTLGPTSTTDHIYGYSSDATSEGSRPKRRPRRVQTSYFESRRSEYTDSTQDATLLGTDQSRDLNEFFEESALNTGGNTTRKCKLCWKHGTLKVMVEDGSTAFRRHLEAFHESSYNKWANMNRFVSKLPGAVKRRKDAKTAYNRSREASPDLEVAAKHSSETIPYNDDLSRKTVMRWLMETNPTIDHPRFKGILVLSPRPTRSVITTSRRTSRSRVKLFKDNLIKLCTRTKKKNISQG